MTTTWAYDQKCTIDSLPAGLVPPEMIDAIAAVLINSLAGLQLLSAQSPDLEEVRQVLDSIRSAGTRAGDIAVRTREVMKKVAAAH